MMPPKDPKCAKMYEEIYRLIYSVRPPTLPGGFPQGRQGMAMRWSEYADNVGNWQEGSKKVKTTQLLDIAIEWSRISDDSTLEYQTLDNLLKPIRTGTNLTFLPPWDEESTLAWLNRLANT